MSESMSVLAAENSPHNRSEDKENINIRYSGEQSSSYNCSPAKFIMNDFAVINEISEG